MSSEYDHHPLKFYMQASNFSINHKDADILCKSLGNTVDYIEWRTEMRVDTYQPGLLKKLFKSGLRIVDLGIDSASPDMLKLMNKSYYPSDYLEKAILLMSEAYEIGIFCKVNMLVHPGDTRESLNKSEKWLRDNQMLISAVSVSPTLVFPGTDLDINFNYYQKSFGTNKLNNSELSSYEVYEIDPSVEINNNHAKEYSLRLF